jgi:hypothetical protein
MVLYLQVVLVAVAMGQQVMLLDQQVQQIQEVVVVVGILLLILILMPAVLA